MDKFPDIPGQGEGLSLPEEFFSNFLPEIDDLAELKVILYAYWILHHSEIDTPVIFRSRLDELLSADGLTKISNSTGLHGLIEKKAIFEASILSTNGQTVDILILNTPRGQAALEAIQNGSFKLQPDSFATSSESKRQPNVFQLYEENIGIITPILADSLRDLEEEYSPDWIAEAFAIALKQNVRNLRYIEAVLEKRKEGKDDRTNRGSRKKAQEKPGTEGYTTDQFPGLLTED